MLICVCHRGYLPLYMGFNGPFLFNVSLPKCCKYTIISSEGALYVVMPYDYPAQQQHPLFEDTPVLNNNLKHFCHDDFGDYDD